MHHNKKCVKIISYKMVFRSFNKFIMRYINNSFKNRKQKKNFKKRKKRFLKAKRRINLFFRRLSILIFILGMISLIISGGIFILNKIFSVKSIECNETEMYSCSEIVSASGIKIGDKILFLNNALSEIKIYDKFSYIDSVKVDVQFPDKVKISVDKAEPTFSFNLEEGKYAVISKKNKFIETRSEKSDDLIDVVGAKFSINKCTVNYEDKSVPILLEKLVNGFNANGLSLKEIDITDINNIIVNYDNRINIELGNDSDIDYKITTAKEIILKKLSKTDVGRLDVKNIKSENRSYFDPN